MAEWLINGQTPEDLGVVIAGGEWRTGGPSTVRLKAVRAFDGAEIFAEEDAVLITRNGAPWFSGTVVSIPKSGSGDSESHEYLIADAWHQMEKTIYQEPWAQNGGTFLSPQVVLGMNSEGASIGLGQQVEAAIDFAAASGINIASGSIPIGMKLWASEESGITIAEVIRKSLRFKPDWVAWIDHSANPPTFNVTPTADATLRTVSVEDLTSFTCTRTAERVPDVVRIVYLTANLVEDNVFRQSYVDKYPLGGADSGPGVLTTVVELAGLKQQIEKQQIMTRDLPVDYAGIQPYLKKKFPRLGLINDAHYQILGWKPTFVPPPEETITDPIDEKMPRLEAESLDDMPRELVKGNLSEWMRKKVGKISIEYNVVPLAAATAAERKALSQLPTKLTITGTNAQTKIYKGVSSYTAGEDAPVNLAQQYLETLQAGCYFEGQAEITETNFGSKLWHGVVLNLTDGHADWATMRAPVHSVQWDLQSETCVLGFGPNPDYSVQDFLEFIRLLNKRKYTPYTVAERTGDTLGAEAGISANGDSIGGFDGPETIVDAGAEVDPPPFKLSVKNQDGSFSWAVSDEYSTIIDEVSGLPIDLTLAGFNAYTAIAEDKHIVLSADVDEDLELSNWIFEAVAAADANPVILSEDETRQVKLRLRVGKVKFVDGLPIPLQSCRTAKMITTALVNGLFVKVLIGDETHPNAL